MEYLTGSMVFVPRRCINDAASFGRDPNPRSEPRISMKESVARRADRERSDAVL
jgi:hypothetical protein